MAVVVFPFVLALGVVAVSGAPQPLAVVLCVVVGWYFALRLRGGVGSQLALLGTLLVFLFSTMKAWWLDDSFAIGLIVASLFGIAFLAVTGVANWRAKE